MSERIKVKQALERVVVVELSLRVGPVKLEIPSTSLRAGSSLRLKNGSAQDDSRSVIVKLHHNLRAGLNARWLCASSGRAERLLGEPGELRTLSTVLN